MIKQNNNDMQRRADDLRDGNIILIEGTEWHIINVEHDDDEPTAVTLYCETLDDDAWDVDEEVFDFSADEMVKLSDQD